MVKERPILFSGEMVRAILDGKKTQTRRVIKKVIVFSSQDKLPNGWSWEKRVFKDSEGYDDAEFIGVPPSPFGQPGDCLWVRETWDVRFLEGVLEKQLCFRADMTSIKCPENFKGELNYNWRPSIFMPRWASRILLEIVNIRVERLQDITESDAEKEGMTVKKVNIPQPGFKVGDPLESYRDVFKFLWNSINGKYPWESNPWVWVIEFKKVEG
jgi:hypothetical protein